MAFLPLKYGFFLISSEKQSIMPPNALVSGTLEAKLPVLAAKLAANLQTVMLQPMGWMPTI